MFGLSFLTPKLIAIAVIVIAFLGLLGRERYATYQWHTAQAETKAAIAERDRVADVADRNAAAVREVTGERDAARTASERAKLELRRRAAAHGNEITNLKREIANAATSNECPVGPSVLAALAGLRNAGGSADGDRGAGDAAGDLGRAH